MLENPRIDHHLKKNSMSEINQPLSGGLDTSPPMTATRHSHASDSDHETDSIEEDVAGVNPDAMMVDEGFQAGGNPRDNSYNGDGNSQSLGGRWQH